MSHFRPIDRKTAYLLPPSVDEWLPEDHLARFIVEAVDGLDLSRLEQGYGGGGSAAYHPAQLLSLLVYGYATGVFSSRKIERATYDSVAFRFIAAGSHPDHDTLATFRGRFLDELAGIFGQVMEGDEAVEAGHDQPGRHQGSRQRLARQRALSHGHIEKLEAHLKAEVQELLALAEQADRADVPDGVNLPAEIKRREERLLAMAEAKAKAKIAARAQERFEREQAAYAAKVAQRDAKTKKNGKKPGGKPPQPPVAGVKSTDQINLTDEESRIMPMSGGTPAQDEARAGFVCAQEAVRGAGVQHYQIRLGVPSVSPARTEQGRWRMAPGVSGLEFEAHGHIAPPDLR